MSVASLASVPIRCGEAEEPWLSEMDWATPQYLRNQVDKAGFTLADANATPAELALAFDVITIGGPLTASLLTISKTTFVLRCATFNRMS